MSDEGIHEGEGYIPPEVEDLPGAGKAKRRFLQGVAGLGTALGFAGLIIGAKGESEAHDAESTITNLKLKLKQKILELVQKDKFYKDRDSKDINGLRSENFVEGLGILAIAFQNDSDGFGTALSDASFYGNEPYKTFEDALRNGAREFRYDTYSSVAIKGREAVVKKHPDKNSEWVDHFTRMLAYIGTREPNIGIIEGGPLSDADDTFGAVRALSSPKMSPLLSDRAQSLRQGFVNSLPPPKNTAAIKS